MKKTLAGVDEVGRGSLIGPVFAAAVILNNNINKKILKDSKSLSKNKRENLEKYNILNASLLAMKRAIKKLKTKPKIILVDGNKIPDMRSYNLRYVIKGDQKIPEISAASIIAKVSRDRLIKKLAKIHRGYFWHKNAGYGTKDHLQALKKFGVTKYHRKKFKPIHNILSLEK